MTYKNLARLVNKTKNEEIILDKKDINRKSFKILDFSKIAQSDEGDSQLNELIDELFDDKPKEKIRRTESADIVTKKAERELKEIEPSDRIKESLQSEKPQEVSVEIVEKTQAISESDESGVCDDAFDDDEDEIIDLSAKRREKKQALSGDKSKKRKAKRNSAKGDKAIKEAEAILEELSEEPIRTEEFFVRTEKFSDSKAAENTEKGEWFGEALKSEAAKACKKSDEEEKETSESEPSKKEEADLEKNGEAEAFEEAENNEAAQSKIKIEITKTGKVALDGASKTFGSVKEKVKRSDLLDKETIKDMFFGTNPKKEKAYLTEAADEAENTEVFGSKKKKYASADPELDKLIFDFEYMVTPDQVLDGYMLFYNEFVRKKNIRWTILFGLLAAGFLISIFASTSNIMSCLLMIVCIGIIVIMWANSLSAKKDAVSSSDDVINDSYKLSFYNSRIIIDASELAGDKLYNYPPAMIKFEDIELKVLDYEDLFILVYSKDYIYTVPKQAMNEKMIEIFSAHLKSILGDDYVIFYNKQKIKNDGEKNEEVQEEAFSDGKNDNDKDK